MMGRIEQLEERYGIAFDRAEKYANAIRKHRDMPGDDRCFLDDSELYAVLPEGYVPKPTEVAVTIENCQRFIECRQNPATAYVSPQRRIEELEAVCIAGRKYCQALAAAWCKGQGEIVLDATEPFGVVTAKGLDELFQDWMEKTEAVLGKSTIPQ